MSLEYRLIVTRLEKNPDYKPGEIVEYYAGQRIPTREPYLSQELLTVTLNEEEYLRLRNIVIESWS